MKRSDQYQIKDIIAPETYTLGELFRLRTQFMEFASKGLSYNLSTISRITDDFLIWLGKKED